MKKSESRLEKVDEMISNHASKQSTKTAEPYQVIKKPRCAHLTTQALFKGDKGGRAGRAWDREANARTQNGKQRKKWLIRPLFYLKDWFWRIHSEANC